LENEQEINPIPLQRITKEYKISEPELNKLSKIGYYFSSNWQKNVKKVSEIITTYEISLNAASFSAREPLGKQYDYYDIMIEKLRINVDLNLKRYHFLPSGFLIKGQLLYANPTPITSTERMRMKCLGMEPPYVWEYSPHTVEGKSVHTYLEQHGYTVSLTAAFPNASIVGAANWITSHTLQRELPDVDYIATLEGSDIGWQVRINNLTTNHQKGCCFDGVHEIDPLRWVWKINRDYAKEHIYAGDNKDVLYFKINLWAQYAWVNPGKENETKFLPIFDNDNTEEQQIIGLYIPSDQKDYKIKKTPLRILGGNFVQSMNNEKNK
jgi:hypothetical protein